MGRAFHPGILEVILEEIRREPSPNRAEIARRVCQRLDWRSPNGKPQLMSMRVGLLRLHRLGVISLPPPLKTNGNVRQRRVRPVQLPPAIPVECAVHELPGFRLVPVENPETSAVYNALMDAHHYLGHVPMAGAQIRYMLEWDRGLLGAIGFGASAWKTAPRDHWIGWSPPQRHQRLHLVLNNARFLILPWVRSPNLASRALSLAARRSPGDFTRMYGYAPILLETFVESGRFTGHCYRAANWIWTGRTQGRGKKHVYKTPGVPVKDVWVYPLRRDARRRLCTEVSP
jgi:hypothetical protein